MFTQQIAKPSYVKTKAFGLCGTLALATALLIGAGAVSADETTQPVVDTQPTAANVYTADNGGNVTVTPSETVAPVETPAAPTTVTKTGDTITVENPNVEVTFPNGNGKYSPFEVEYKDIQIPDNVPVNEGDKVTFDLPQEVKFQTSYEFDVHNPEKAVVGKATADATTNKVTTVFNDYFKSHPLNKIMNLKLDASWTDKVVSGKPVTANFNGTLVTTNIGSEQVIGKDELITKWGSQDKDDPTVINWTARVNYAKRVLNYVTIIDEMSENQKLVDNFFEVKNIESVDPWIDKGDAMDLVKSISKSDHGFTIKMDRLDHMIYINYKTKLVNAVKDSVNPTNKIELKAETDGATSYSYVQLVGGKGDASGENKPEPTFEIPREAPKVDIPEFEGGIPGIPEERVKPEYTEPIGTVPNDAPVLDKPEWNGGTVPFDAPQYDKPEWNGGVVPNDAPVYDKPSINLEDIPMMPPAPILEKPELVIEIPSEPVKPTKPSENTPNKPIDKPKDKEVEITEVTYKLDSEGKQVANTPVYEATLPNTGEEEGIASTLGLIVIAAGITGLTLSFKKYNEK